MGGTTDAHNAPALPTRHSRHSRRRIEPPIVVCAELAVRWAGYCARGACGVSCPWCCRYFWDEPGVLTESSLDSTDAPTVGALSVLSVQ